MPELTVNSASKDSHIPVLDGIRGLAILGVLFYHFWGVADARYTALPGIARRLFSVAIIGAKGVDLFFVLSGFLITGILLRTKGSNHYFKNFYIRRSLRIFPLYYLTVIGCLVVGTVASIPGYQWRSMIWYFFYLHNVRDTFWQPPIGGPGWFWSLAVEEHFYLFWPLIVLLLRRRHLVYFSLFLMILAPAVRAIFVARGMILFFTLCRMDALAAGALLAILFTEPAYWQQAVIWTRRLVLPVGIPAFISSFWLTGSQNHPIAQTLKFSLFALLCAFVLVLSLSGGKANPIPAICRMKWLRSIGKTSYSMYLLHPFIVVPLVGVLYSAEWSPVRGKLWLDLVLDLALFLALTILVSRITWVAIEHPFINLKHRFQYSTRNNSVQEDSVDLRQPPVEVVAVTETAQS
jgi:peptidoglycan/LPS O-acetylase OafA/YrhL